MTQDQSRNSGRGLIAALVAIVIIGGIGAIGYVGMQYYQSRYVGDTYYARVPADAVITLDDMLDSDGKVMDQGHEYTLTGYNEAGETTTLEFPVYADNQADLYQPGTYIKAEASATLVVKQQVITESEVPAAVLKHLE